MKIPTSQPDGITDISSSNKVTSTTSPTVAEQGKLIPWWKSLKVLQRSLQRFLTIIIINRRLRISEDITNDLLFLICGYTSTHRLKLVLNNSFGLSTQ